MSRRATLHAIVLAAGASMRFGSPKQLIRLDGQPMLQQLVSRATEVAGRSVSVILGANAAQIAPVLALSSATVLINRDWREGIAGSIRTGVLRLPGSCDGALLMLADQPRVSTEVLNRLVAVWRRQPTTVVASIYAGVTGVPAVFPRWCFGDLLSLRGDQGARLLMRRYADRLVRIENPEAAVDIDVPEDLLELGVP